jgi:cytochrome c553
MQGYKDGTYGGAMKSMMMGQVATLSKEQMEAIADYIVK